MLRVMVNIERRTELVKHSVYRGAHTGARALLVILFTLYGLAISQWSFTFSKYLYLPSRCLEEGGGGVSILFFNVIKYTFEDLIRIQCRNNSMKFVSTRY
jgi:hypothetical protein